MLVCTTPPPPKNWSISGWNVGSRGTMLIRASDNLTTSCSLSLSCAAKFRSRHFGHPHRPERDVGADTPRRASLICRVHLAPSVRRPFFSPSPISCQSSKLRNRGSMSILLRSPTLISPPSTYRATGPSGTEWTKPLSSFATSPPKQVQLSDGVIPRVDERPSLEQT